MTIKSYLRPQYEFAYRSIASAGVAARRIVAPGRPKVAHQGIQRSGTNYACALLGRLGYDVLNRIDPRRDSPRHKHFRWQDDKSTIVMDAAFKNQTIAANVSEINSLAGFPTNTKHLVFFRRPSAWLPSIYTWGLAHSWVEPDIEFRVGGGVALDWLREWDAYYSKWFSLAEREPDMVLPIFYDDLRERPVETSSTISAFTSSDLTLKEASNAEFSKVRHSPRRSEVSNAKSSDQCFNDADESVAADWRRWVRFAND